MHTYTVLTVHWSSYIILQCWNENRTNSVIQNKSLHVHQSTSVLQYSELYVPHVPLFLFNSLISSTGISVWSCTSTLIDWTLHMNMNKNTCMCIMPPLQILEACPHFHTHCTFFLIYIFYILSSMNNGGRLNCICTFSTHYRGKNIGKKLCG